MHNRARLVVGSFLTKDLGIDWRLGERWFMRLLIDGDEANNNGNWQWIASVGVDPQPYYRRIYNPARHMERFDPHGAYVRRYVPELRDVPDEYLREPWTMPDEVQRGVRRRDRPRLPRADRRPPRRRASARMERYRAAHGGLRARLGAWPRRGARRCARRPRAPRADQQVVEDRRRQPRARARARRPPSARGSRGRRTGTRARDLRALGGRLQRAVGPAEPAGDELLAATRGRRRSRRAARSRSRSPGVNAWTSTTCSSAVLARLVGVVVAEPHAGADERGARRARRRARRAWAARPAGRRGATARPRTRRRRRGAARAGTRGTPASRSGRWCRIAWPKTRSNESSGNGSRSASVQTRLDRRARAGRRDRSSASSMPGRDVGGDGLADDARAQQVEREVARAGADLERAVEVPESAGRAPCAACRGPAARPCSS